MGHRQVRERASGVGDDAPVSGMIQLEMVRSASLLEALLVLAFAGGRSGQWCRPRRRARGLDHVVPVPVATVPHRWWFLVRRRGRGPDGAGDLARDAAWNPQRGNRRTGRSRGRARDAARTLTGRPDLRGRGAEYCRTRTEHQGGGERGHRGEGAGMVRTLTTKRRRVPVEQCGCTGDDDGKGARCAGRIAVCRGVLRV